MYSWDNPDDRVAIAQMNSELRNAELELISAHCATHQLRLRYSSEDLIRFGQRDVLRKSVQAASALNEYYASLDKKMTSEEFSGPSSSQAGRVTAEQIKEASDCVAAYLRE
jgi:hypothetical protein